MPVMILAAGRGERMQPLTDVTPKPMLAVRGKPLLQWHLEALAQAGLGDITINIAHLGQSIRAFAGDGSRFGVTIRYSEEPPGALETAGGIATARPWVRADGSHDAGPFLVINADIWTDWPRRRALDIRDRLLKDRNQLRCHVVLVDNPPHHLQGDFCLSPQGPVDGPGDGPSHDKALALGQGAAIEIHKVLPKGIGASLTFSGIGVYDPHMFDGLKAGVRAPLAPLLHQAIAAGQCSGEHHRGIWSDVGTPERLQSLNS